MISVAIAALLASIAIPSYQGYMEKARIARCIAEIRYLERDILAYYVSYDKYPDSMLDLGSSMVSFTDPWGYQYQYLLIAGTNFASNGGGGGKYYARGSWTSDMVTAAAGRAGGFWSSSWFVSEAWAASGGVTKPRKDRFLTPINSDYDLYSMGPDGESNEPLTVPVSRDDIIRASDGAYVGVAENF